MPFKYKKVLLKENDNITVNELCAIIKRQFRIDQIISEPQYTTAFNTLNASRNPTVAQAIESIMLAVISSTQVAQSPHHRVESTQYPNRLKEYNYPEEEITTEVTTTTDKHTSIMENRMDEVTVTTTTAEDVTVEAFTGRGNYS